MAEALLAAPVSEMVTLASGCRTMLDDEAQAAIAGFLLDQLGPDGGFRGRGPDSDLYYTLFAVDALAALDRAIEPERISTFVEGHGDGAGLDLVHLTCLARLLSRIGDPCGRLPSVVARLRALRSPSGGFRLPADAGHDSIYAAFLAQLVGAEIGVNLLEPTAIAASVQALRADDGGFGSRPGLAVGTTTVTAAAVVVLMLARRPDQVAAEWLLTQVRTDRGFLASPVTPLPDLLSTASALLALGAFGHPLAGLSADCLDLIDELWHDNGGFAGHQLDDVTDSEYTFYALLTLGLCAGAL